MAGGGGGAGQAGCATGVENGGNGGQGGGGDGLDGVNSPAGGGGKGGKTALAGAAGIGCGSFLGQPGQLGSGIVGGNGGAGQSCCCNGGVPGGGGGGGGLIPGSGGGGGSAGTIGCQFNNTGGGGGGAGGTSTTLTLLNGSTSQGVQVGNGLVRLCYSSLLPTPTPTVTLTPIPEATQTVVVANKSLKYELLANSFGKGDFSSPAIKVLSEGTSVRIKSCFNFRKIKRGYSRLTSSLRNNLNKIISKKTLTPKNACLELDLTQTGDFALKFVQSARGKTSLRSKATKFRIKQ